MSWPIEGQSLFIEANAELLLDLNIEAHTMKPLKYNGSGVRRRPDTRQAEDSTLCSACAACSRNGVARDSTGRRSIGNTTSSQLARFGERSRLGSGRKVHCFSWDGGSKTSRVYLLKNDQTVPSRLSRRSSVKLLLFLMVAPLFAFGQVGTL